MALPTGPLEGIRVLDLTRVLVGPFATMMLADLGADVIKLESPGEGDVTRHVPPLQDGQSHYYTTINRNKRGIAVDLKRPEGREIAVALARRCDVLVENFRPGVVARLGLDYPTLKPLNPRLVYCSISAFGQDGPYSQRPALDIAIQALSGALHLTGEPDRPPVRMGSPMADLAAALHAVIGVQAALIERDRTGRGQYIDLSMLDAMVGMLMYNAGRVWMGEMPERQGNGNQGIVPYGLYRCADGEMVIANIGENFWPKICAALALDDLAADPRFKTNAGRLPFRDQIDGRIAAAMAGRTVAELGRIFEAHDVPHAPVLSVAEALEDEQVRARGMVTELEHPVLGRWPALNRGIRMPNHAGAPLSPAPLLGQHTREVLSDLLGYPPELTDRLLREGVVEEEGWPPP